MYVSYNNWDGSTNLIDDETDSFGNPDNLFGNKQKKAERKVRKAEKQLAKGHIKQAQRKLKKAEPILSKIAATKQAIADQQAKIADINKVNPVIDTTNTGQTENMNTAPGQIGSASGTTTTTQGQAASSSLGGGAGDISSDNSLPVMESTANPVNDTPDATTKTDLPGVTVSKKTNWLVIGIIILIAVAGVYLIMKKGKKK